MQETAAVCLLKRYLHCWADDAHLFKYCSTNSSCIHSLSGGILSRYYWTVDNANQPRFTGRSYHL